MIGEFYFEVRCLEPGCVLAAVPFYSVELRDGRSNATEAALEHSWRNDGHECHVWYDGRPILKVQVSKAKSWTPADGMAELQMQIRATRQEAVRAIRHKRETGEWSPRVSGEAWVLINSVPMDGSKHVAEFHCVVDEETERCVICDVSHKNPCPDCSGRGYHRLPCIILDPKRSIFPVEERV